MKRNLAKITVIAVGLLWGCDSAPPTSTDFTLDVQQLNNEYEIIIQGEMAFSIEVQKWYDGHQAAVSLNYDAAWGTHEKHHLATDAVISRGMRMDLEMVSWVFQLPERQHLIDVYHEQLVPFGIHFFGHGHTHALHDTMEFDEAYASFRLNFELMREWGFNPKVYAYPGSSGERKSTQLANREAGFIAARGYAPSPEKYYICPGQTREPENWYFLPSVVMGQEYSSMVENHSELSPILEQALASESWLILMYHAIGIPEGWGYYPLEEFTQDLDQIATGNFWNGNMDSVVQYIMERNAFEVDLVSFSENRGENSYIVRFKDGLDNTIFDQPLTVELEFGPDLTTETILFDPPIGSVKKIDERENRIQINILPDEQEYLIQLKSK